MAQKCWFFFQAKLKEDPSVFVGAIVCKLDQHRMARRGYIAMLAVHSDYRRYKIASSLVRYAIHQMSRIGCDEVSRSGRPPVFFIFSDTCHQGMLQLWKYLPCTM